MSTSHRILLVTLAWVLFVSVPPASAQQTPPPLPAAIQMVGGQVSLTQMVTVRVSEINQLSISGDVLIPFAAVPAGTPPQPATDASATYSITLNGTGKKIIGSLDADFPAGMALELTMAAPTGALSTTQVLSTAPADLVTGLSLVSATGLALSYTGTVDITTPPSGASGVSRRVTLTLVDN